MRPAQFKVSIIIPIFNEEGNVAKVAAVLTDILSAYPSHEIIFVNDGSRDQTLGVVKQEREKNGNIHFLSFSRNFGHQNALRAGLDHAAGDCVISMDGDLQHPPELIPTLIENWLAGYDIVYTRRKDDPSLPLSKRLTSRLFYAITNMVSDVKIDPGAADFRLIDKSVLAVLKELKESHIFMRGMIAWVGFRQLGIEYVPHERVWGKSQYTFKKMFALALSGVTSFSIKPLHMATFFGFCAAAASFLYALYAISIKCFTDQSIPGWTSVLVSVLFMGGVQLITIGILGEYIGKLFIESKGRPHYIVKEKSL